MSLVSNSDVPSPRDRALLHSLSDVGHSVTMSRPGRSLLFGDHLVAHTTWTPSGPVPLTRARRVRPEVIHAANSQIMGTADRIARAVDGWVGRRPDWPVPTRDLIGVVPERPELSVPVGQPVPEPRPWSRHAGSPAPGRHAGRSVVLAYRPTPASPAHPLRRALERAGVTLTVTDRLDFEEMSATDIGVVVESPTPPIEMTGANPGVPIVFWVHHGEHHIDGNVRLARRYGADLVLLAHSWHLASRFDCRVERFPFAAEPLPDPMPFSQRRWDLAFIGRVDGSAYRRRQELVEQARESLGQVMVGSDVAPAEIPTIYGDSRLVLNEGGIRHLPITMRVFEAIGAGALLVTDPAPGLDLLLAGGFVSIDAAGIDATRLADLVAGGEAEALARRAHETVLTQHTYDHRVDLLFRLSESTGHGKEPPALPATPLERFLAGHPYGQRLLDLTGEAEVPDREVWRLDDVGGDPRPGTFDTVIAGAGADPAHARAARRFVVGVDLDAASLEVTPRSVSEDGAFTIVDVGGAGYDMQTLG